MKTISQIPKRPKKSLRSWKERTVIFNCRIREIREAHNLTLRDVSATTKLPIATIQRIERGFACELAKAMILAKFFEQPVEKLFALLPEKRNG